MLLEPANPFISFCAASQLDVLYPGHESKTHTTAQENSLDLIHQERFTRADVCWKSYLTACDGFQPSSSGRIALVSMLYELETL